LARVRGTLSTPSQPATEPHTTRERTAWAILIVLTLYVCYFSHLGAIGFVGPDEPRYAWIARDMAESGDWITPRLYGRPWFEKPPLLYWGGAFFFKLLGENHPEVAARLPSAICALLATLALAWLAWRTHGRECARWLLLLLPGSVGMIGFSHAAATDMPFAAMLTMAMVPAAVVLGLIPRNEHTPILPHKPTAALLLFGFFLGLAVLAKGPAAIVLMGGTVFFWALSTKRWRDALRLFHPFAILAFCLTALPWYAACARRNPDFFRIFIIEHNFKRFLTPEFQHLQPFWYYLPVLLLGLFPWFLLLLPVGRALRTSRGTPEGPIFLFFAIAALFTLLFFTVSQSKLPGYILPSIPAIAFLAATTVPALLNRGRLRSIVVLSMLLTLPVAFFAARQIYRTQSSAGSFRFPASFGAAALCLLLGVLAAVTLGLRRRSAAAFLTGQLALLAALWVSLAGDGGRLMDALLSSRPAARSYERLGAPGPAGSPGDPGPFTYELRRAHQYSLNFYFRRELPVWSGDASQAAVIFLSPRRSQLAVRCLENHVVPAVSLCRWEPSLSGPGARRQLQ
jgi:4-amino-4-deoxy-L-arabinose transferase-like glycosyltransferase